MQDHQQFLKFNEVPILYTTEEGETFIAIKPICQALGVDHSGQQKRIKRHPILGSVYAKHTIQVPNDQARSMTCVPEKYVYGWLFSINSESLELLEYQKTCYELLYNHFHGSIGGRKELLKSRASLDAQIFNIKKELKENDSDFKRLNKLLHQRKQLSQRLNQMDYDALQVEMQFQESLS